jgi:hypothetical protein
VVFLYNGFEINFEYFLRKWWMVLFSRQNKSTVALYCQLEQCTEGHMATQIEVEFPAAMKPKVVAKTFAAYLLGSNAFGPARGVFAHAAIPNCWKIDGNSRFWLQIEGARATVYCCHSDQGPVLEAMVALFKLRYPVRADC